MNLEYLLSMIFVLAALVGLVLVVIYAVRRRLFSPRQWGVGLLCAAAWGIGGFVGSMAAGDAWASFFEKSDHTIHEIIYDYIGLQSYYSLALSPILAAVFGIAALYLLTRYLPEKASR